MKKKILVKDPGPSHSYTTYNYVDQEITVDGECPQKIVVTTIENNISQSKREIIVSNAGISELYHILYQKGMNVKNALVGIAELANFLGRKESCPKCKHPMFTESCWYCSYPYHERKSGTYSLPEGVVYVSFREGGLFGGTLELHVFSKEEFLVDRAIRSLPRKIRTKNGVLILKSAISPENNDTHAEIITKYLCGYLVTITYKSSWCIARDIDLIKIFGYPVILAAGGLTYIDNVSGCKPVPGVAW